MLRLYNEWDAAGGVRRGLNWAKQNYVHSRAMCRAYDVREQLVQIMQRYDMPIIKANRYVPSVPVRVHIGLCVCLSVSRVCLCT